MWSVQDAKSRFSEMLDAAEHAPQFIIKQGRRAVVALAAEEYDRLKALEQRQNSSFKEQLLNMPKDDGAFERLPSSLREPKF
ncbi:prevent-host-death family protein [Rhizomicrobium palustre]|uniref:Antitoxin n=1 Tax=Rhizomicrobium palustre TaxID=189966 RepID=A0A846MWS2_9PROT|nr:type II toxin-antitoxin system Phd/YefM family antitoxin [Rhizomicrobium palustre]NIK87480.1 prevent-host-death family protein [Rhizomicrobium palustre]